MDEDADAAAAAAAAADLDWTRRVVEQHDDAFDATEFVSVLRRSIKYPKDPDARNAAIRAFKQFNGGSTERTEDSAAAKRDRVDAFLSVSPSADEILQIVEDDARGVMRRALAIRALVQIVTVGSGHAANQLVRDLLRKHSSLLFNVLKKGRDEPAALMLELFESLARKGTPMVNEISARFDLGSRYLTLHARSDSSTHEACIRFVIAMIEAVEPRNLGAVLRNLSRALEAIANSMHTLMPNGRIGGAKARKPLSKSARSHRVHLYSDLFKALGHKLVRALLRRRTIAGRSASGVIFDAASSFDHAVRFRTEFNSTLARFFSLACQVRDLEPLVNYIEGFLTILVLVQKPRALLDTTNVVRLIHECCKVYSARSFTFVKKIIARRLDCVPELLTATGAVPHLESPGLSVDFFGACAVVQAALLSQVSLPRDFCEVSRQGPVSTSSSDTGPKGAIVDVSNPSSSWPSLVSRIALNLLAPEHVARCISAGLTNADALVRFESLASLEFLLRRAKRLLTLFETEKKVSAFMGSRLLQDVCDRVLSCSSTSSATRSTVESTGSRALFWNSVRVRYPDWHVLLSLKAKLEVPVHSVSAGCIRSLEHDAILRVLTSFLDIFPEQLHRNHLDIAKFVAPGSFQALRLNCGRMGLFAALDFCQRACETWSEGAFQILSKQRMVDSRSCSFFSELLFEYATDREPELKESIGQEALTMKIQLERLVGTLMLSTGLFADAEPPESGMEHLLWLNSICAVCRQRPRCERSDSENFSFCVEIGSLLVSAKLKPHMFLDFLPVGDSGTDMTRGGLSILLVSLLYRIARSQGEQERLIELFEAFVSLLRTSAQDTLRLVAERMESSLAKDSNMHPFELIAFVDDVLARERSRKQKSGSDKVLVVHICDEHARKRFETYHAFISLMNCGSLTPEQDQRMKDNLSISDPCLSLCDHVLPSLDKLPSNPLLIFETILAELLWSSQPGDTDKLYNSAESARRDRRFREVAKYIVGKIESSECDAALGFGCLVLAVDTSSRAPPGRLSLGAFLVNACLEDCDKLFSSALRVDSKASNNDAADCSRLVKWFLQLFFQHRYDAQVSEKMLSTSQYRHVVLSLQRIVETHPLAERLLFWFVPSRIRVVRNVVLVRMHRVSEAIVRQNSTIDDDVLSILIRDSQACHASFGRRLLSWFKNGNSTFTCTPESVHARTFEACALQKSIAAWHERQQTVMNANLGFDFRSSQLDRFLVLSNVALFWPCIFYEMNSRSAESLVHVHLRQACSKGGGIGPAFALNVVDVLLGISDARSTILSLPIDFSPLCSESDRLSDSRIARAASILKPQSRGKRYATASRILEWACDVAEEGHWSSYLKVLLAIGDTGCGTSSFQVNAIGSLLRRLIQVEKDRLDLDPALVSEFICRQLVCWVSPKDEDEIMDGWNRALMTCTMLLSHTSKLSVPYIRQILETIETTVCDKSHMYGRICLADSNLSAFGAFLKVLIQEHVCGSLSTSEAMPDQALHAIGAIEQLIASRLYSASDSPGDELMRCVANAIDRLPELDAASAKIGDYRHGLLALDSTQVLGELEPSRIQAITSRPSKSPEFTAYGAMFVLRHMHLAIQDARNVDETGKILDLDHWVRSGLVGCAIWWLSSNNDQDRLYAYNVLAGLLEITEERRVPELQMTSESSGKNAHVQSSGKYGTQGTHKDASLSIDGSSEHAFEGRHGHLNPSAAFFKERKQFVFFLIRLRHAVTEPLQRILPLTAAFLRFSLDIFMNPGHALFVPLTHFWLSKPQLALDDAPILNYLLSLDSFSVRSGDSVEQGIRAARLAVIRLMREGTRTWADHLILKRRHLYEIMMVLISSENTSVDIGVKRAALLALADICRSVSGVALDVVQSNGILAWLASLAEWCVGELLPEALHLLATIAHCMAVGEYGSMCKDLAHCFKVFALYVANRVIAESGYEACVRDKILLNVEVEGLLEPLWQTLESVSVLKHSLADAAPIRFPSSALDVLLCIARQQKAFDQALELFTLCVGVSSASDGTAVSHALHGRVVQDFVMLCLEDMGSTAGSLGGSRTVSSIGQAAKSVRHCAMQLAACSRAVMDLEFMDSASKRQLASVLVPLFGHALLSSSPICRRYLVLLGAALVSERRGDRAPKRRKVGERAGLLHAFTVADMLQSLDHGDREPRGPISEEPVIHARALRRLAPPPEDDGTALALQRLLNALPEQLLLL
ncbi:hypothetical protein FVE85_9072 [Porphyridium purpureum]|uniref:URB1 C-terminal domain-containing protein n=1 Tax=Porphyridium purpureum TaxID=35688 RepID=A0A5J4YPB0_PORPP|nr:hypothetical protein FVE85_9072 [Porphyridium purpureum]|eukprot:POR6789..scf222_8